MMALDIWLSKVLAGRSCWPLELYGGRVQEEQWAGSWMFLNLPSSDCQEVPDWRVVFKDILGVLFSCMILDAKWLQEFRDSLPTKGSHRVGCTTTGYLVPKLMGPHCPATLLSQCAQILCSLSLRVCGWICLPMCQKLSTPPREGLRCT